MSIQITLLGRFSARRGTDEIPSTSFRQRLVRRLVRILLTHRGEFVSRDLLVECLWPQRAPVDPAANLQVLVNRARRALGDASLILTGSAGYSFTENNGCVVDAEVFLARVSAGHDGLIAGQVALAAKEFRAALQLWGDPLAEDAYEDWARDYRSMLQRAYVQALEEGAQAALAIRDPATAVALAQLAVSQEPLREAAHLLLVRALGLSGDLAGALSAFDRLRKGFNEQLGLDPSREAFELQTQLLRREPTVTMLPSRPASAPSALPLEVLAFVGREQELDEILEVAAARTPRAVLVSGSAGAGKSRLLAEVAARLNMPVLAVRAFRPERDQDWALGRSVLREALALVPDAAFGIPDRIAHALTDIVPEMEDLRPVKTISMDPESRRALALEGGVRILEFVGSGPVALAVDDLQWADATSLAFLASVAERVPRLVLIVAYRPEEMDPIGPMAAFFTEVGAGDLLRICLRPLSAEAIAWLLPQEDLAKVLVASTDCTPFVVAEVVRLLALRGVVSPDAQGRWRATTEGAGQLARETARAGQQRATQMRVSLLLPDQREVLSLLALLGREVPSRLLAAAGRKAQKRVLDALDALARTGLVRLGETGWGTTHDLISETVRESLNQTERGHLHAILAQVLDQEDADPSELARHLEEAGDREGAGAAFLRAGRQSLDRFAAVEAQRLAEAGLRLRLSSPVRSGLLEIRAEARTRRGDPVGASADLRVVLRAQPAGPERSRILVRIAMIESGTQDFSKAAELVELAQIEAGNIPEARAEVLEVGAVLDINTGRLDRAEARLAEAMTLFEALGDSRGVGSVLDLRAMNTLMQGHVRKASAMFDRAARWFQDAGQLQRFAMARGTRGWSLSMMGRPEQGLSDADEALEISRTLGHAEDEATGLWARSWSLIGIGRLGEARESAETALVFSRRVGHREMTAASLWSLGIVCQAAGDLAGAEVALGESLDLAPGIPIVSSGAAATLASVLVAQGNLTSADLYVAICLADGPPLLHIEGRLVQAELDLLRGHPEASMKASRALALAEAEGWLWTPARVRLQERIRMATSTRRA